MKKFITLLLVIFAMAGTVNADVLDLDLSKLSHNSIHNSETHVITFPASKWDEDSWWLSDTGLDYSNCNQFVLEYTTDKNIQFRVYFDFGNGTESQHVYQASNSSEGKTTITLDENGKSSIKKIAITAANQSEEFSITLTRAYFKTSSETTGTTETVSSTETTIGNWDNTLDLSYNNKGGLANANINDVIKVTFTSNSGDDHHIRIANPSGEEAFESSSAHDIFASSEEQLFTYTIKSASILELIQLTGIKIKGKYITIKKVEITKPDNRYDAVPAVIGSEGIATFSSSKNLDFTGLAITPYYAESVETGKINLVSTTSTRQYVGYIIKGSEGSYEIPVAQDAPDWHGYLRGTNDYQGTVYRSKYEDYTGTDDNAENIKTKYRYIFAKKKDGDNTTIGFYKLTTDHTLAAHKAYLETSEDISTPAAAGGKRSVSLDFGDGTTAIFDVFQDETRQNTTQGDGCYYTLQGVRVEKPTKGLYILNGKKVLIK